MKYILAVLAALVFFAAAAQAQTAYPDLIVTQTGDSIRCVFRSFTNDAISYYRMDGYGNAAKGIAQKSALRYFDRGYYTRRETAAAGRVQYEQPMASTARPPASPIHPSRTKRWPAWNLALATGSTRSTAAYRRSGWILSRR